MDLKLTVPGHDLSVEDGDLVLLDGVESIAQHLRIRLQFFLEEWFLDTRIGIPYYQRLLGQKPQESVVRAIFRPAIESTPGVEALNDLQVDYDGASRALAVSFRALTDTGEQLVFDEELIIG